MTYLWGHSRLVMTDMEALNLSFILEVATRGWSSSIQNRASLTRHTVKNPLPFQEVKTSRNCEYKTRGLKPLETRGFNL